MDKMELVNKVAARTGVERDVTKTIIDEAFDQIKDCLTNGEPFFRRGFGTFEVKLRRGGVNNLHGENKKNPDKRKPFFIPSREWVKELNEKNVVRNASPRGERNSRLTSAVSETRHPSNQ